jgi:DNA-binding NarL/FixJ family response regulator
MVSEGLKSLLADEFDLVGIVEDGRELVATAKVLKPDVVVADISMPHLNGIDAVALLRRNNPGIKVVVLTMHTDTAYAKRALKAGCQGFVVKHSAAAELVMAIKAALKGQTFVTPALTRDILRSNDPASTSITTRQRQILRLVAEGHSAKEISANLAISARTVEFHKYRLMETHGLHSTAELIHFAIKSGVVTI